MAKKIGEDAADKLEGLYNLIKQQCSNESDSLILLNLERSPESPDLQKTAAAALAQKMQTNEKFANDVGRLISQAQSGPALNQFNTQVYGKVDKIVSIGEAGDVTIS